MKYTRKSSTGLATLRVFMTCAGEIIDLRIPQRSGQIPHANQSYKIEHDPLHVPISEGRSILTSCDLIKLRMAPGSSDWC